MKNQTFVKFLLNNKITILIIFYWILLFLNLKMNLKFTGYLADAALWLALDIIFDSEVSRFFLTLIVVYNLYKAITCFF